MKKILLAIVLWTVILTGQSFGIKVIEQPLNLSPLMTDQALGIDDPLSVDWEPNRFSYQGIFSLYLTQDFIITGNTFDLTGVLNPVLLGKTTNQIFTDGTYTDTTDPFSWSIDHTTIRGDYDSQTVAASDVGIDGVVTGVKSITAGTNITLGGTATDVIINSIGGGTIAITEEETAPDPATMSTGDMVVSKDDKLSYKSATGSYLGTFIYTLDPVIPTVTTWTVQPDGISSIVEFSEAMTFNTGGSGGFTTDTPTYPYVYASGDTTNTVTFSHTQINSTATDNPLGDFDQPTDGWQSVSGSVELASFQDAAVINNSTQTPSAFLFDWDATTTTADIYGGGTLAATTNGTVALSATQFNSAPTSASTDLGFSYYQFTDTGIMEPTGGTLTFYVYGDESELGSPKPILMYGDASNNYIGTLISSGRIQFLVTLSGTDVNVTSTSGDMLPSQQNEIVLTWADNAGTSTDCTLTVNGGTPVNVNIANVWNVSVDFAYLRVGTNSGTPPTVTLYQDDVRIE